LERFVHVLCHRPGHKQHVSMAWRSHETQTEAFKIVKRVVKRVNLQLAAVAGTGIDFPDRKRATKAPLRRASDRVRQFGDGRFVFGRRDLRQRTSYETLK